MERYIGIDVHSASCTLAVMGPSGKRIRCEVVETNGAALIAAMKRIPGELHVCMEEGLQSAWLCEVMRPHVKELVVEGASERKDRSEPKNDERDAWGLAERLRTGAVKCRVYKAPGEMAGLRDAVRAHTLIVNDVVRVKNRLRAVYRSRGVLVEGNDLYLPVRRDAHLAKLPPSSRAFAEILSQEIDGLEELRETAEAQLGEQAKAHPAVRRLQTVPGLGPIRAAQVVAIAITPHRFPSTRHFWSYCGLSVVTRSSADWVRDGNRWVRSDNVAKTRGLTRRRQPLLKAAFKGAALVVIGRMPEHPLTKKYKQLCDAGTKPPLATLTLARKIAAATLAIWKNEEVYDPARQAARQLPA